MTELILEVFKTAMRGILLDLDGVLYNGEVPIEGAAETIDWVQAKGIPHLFVTNTTSRGRASLVEKLRSFGIRTDVRRIMTPCIAAANWLKVQREAVTALFVDPRARGEFPGIRCLPDDSEAGAGYVVIGDLGDRWNFQTLNRAFRILHADPDSVLIALGMTRFWRAHDGLRLDVAPFIAALEHATGKSALVFGKPAAPFFCAAAEALQLPVHEILMVGDSIETDVEGAQRSGMKGVLVRTGKFRQSDLEGSVKPDAILESIRDLPSWWERL